MKPVVKGGRVRLGKTNVAILTGEADLTEWSEEELRRGQRKAKNGKWVGRPPTVVPKAIHDELVRRVFSKAMETIQDNLVEGVEALCEIALDREADAAVRIKAIGMMMDRVLGRAPVTVKADIEVTARWETALVAGIQTLEAGIIEAEVVEDDDDPFGDE